MFSFLRMAALCVVIWLQLGGTAAASKPEPQKPPRPCPRTPAAAAAASSQPRCQYGFTYGDRPPAVRTVMRLMYGANGHYRTLSAVLVDRLPGDQPGSVRFFVRQPRNANAAEYPNLRGSGTPTEVTAVGPATIERYAPAKGIFTEEDRVLVANVLPPLATVPLGVPQRDEGATSFADADLGAGPLALANVFVHPSGLITGPTFTADRVVVVGKGMASGRRCWILAGASPHAHGQGAASTGWRMWVDRRTGVVLRLLLLQGGRVMGSATLREVRFNGVPGSPGGGDTLARWAVPASAQYLSPEEYVDALKPSDSSPVSWARAHSDTTLGIVVLILLIVIRWFVVHVEQRGTPKQMQHVGTD